MYDCLHRNAGSWCWSSVLSQSNGKREQNLHVGQGAGEEFRLSANLALGPPHAVNPCNPPNPYQKLLTGNRGWDPIDDYCPTSNIDQPIPRQSPRLAAVKDRLSHQFSSCRMLASVPQFLCSSRCNGSSCKLHTIYSSTMLTFIGCLIREDAIRAICHGHRIKSLRGLEQVSVVLDCTWAGPSFSSVGWLSFCMQFLIREVHVRVDFFSIYSWRLSLFLWLDDLSACVAGLIFWDCSRL